MVGQVRDMGEREVIKIHLCTYGYFASALDGMQEKAKIVMFGSPVFTIAVARFYHVILRQKSHWSY